MSAYNKFEVADPSVVKALGGNIKEVYLLKSTGLETVYLLKKNIFDHLNNAMINKNHKISAKEKVFFVPGSSNASYRLRDAVKNVKGKVSKFYTSADVIVFPNLLGDQSYSEENGPENAERVGGNNLSSYRLFSYNLRDYYFIYSRFHDLLEFFDGYKKGENIVLVDNDGMYDIYNQIIRNNSAEKLPETSPWRLQSMLTDGCRHSSMSAYIDDVVVTGYYLNVMYYAAKNKKVVMHENSFLRDNVEASTILDESSIDTIIKMLNSTEDNQRLGAMLLANSDYKDKLHYVYLIGQKAGYYSIDQFKRIKDIKNFIKESNWEAVSTCRPVDFFQYIHENNKTDWLLDPYFIKKFIPSLNTHIETNIKMGQRECIEKGFIKVSYELKLPEGVN